MRKDQVMLAGSVALAVGRLLVGMTALAVPELAARAWVGRESGTGPAARVLGRALGGRDLALAVGALMTARDRNPDDLRRWVALGAGADAVDAMATLANWPVLPRGYRLAILGAAGGAAVAGALAATVPAG